MYRKEEQRLGEGNTCQMSGSPCSKNNKFPFFLEKQHSLSREAATLTPGTHGGGGGRENNGTYKERAAPILPLLFATCCILGLPLMQAGANSFQESWQTMNFHQKTELTFSNFLSGQRAENTSFAGSVCRVGALIFGCGGSVLASFGDSTWYQEFFGSIPPPHPSHLQQFTASASCSLSKPMEPHDPTDSGSSKPSWGKPRPPTPCRVAPPLPVKSQGYRGSASCQQMKRYPLLCRALEHT